MDPLKASANRELGGERPSFPYQMRAHPPAEPLQPSNTSNFQISNLTESTMANLAPAVGQLFDRASTRAPEALQMKTSQETTASDSTIMASPVDPSLSSQNFQSGSSDLQHHRSDGMRVLTPSSATKVSVASGATGTNLNVVQGSFSSNELASRACKPLPPRNGAGAPAGAASNHSAPRAGAPAGSANHRTSPRPTSAPIASGPVKVFTVSLNPAQLQLLQAHGLSPNETGVESVEVEWEGWESEPDTTRSTVGAEQEGGGHFPTSM